MKIRQVCGRIRVVGGVRLSTETNFEKLQAEFESTSKLRFKNITANLRSKVAGAVAFLRESVEGVSSLFAAPRLAFA